LSEAERCYKDLKVGGKWNGVAEVTLESSFKAASQETGVTQSSSTSDGGYNRKKTCRFCKGNHARPECPKYKWYLRECGKKPTATDKKVSSDPICYEKYIDGSLHKFCDKCTLRQGKKETKGRWTVSHHTNEHTGIRRNQNPEGAQDNLSSDTQEETTPKGHRSVSFMEAVQAAASL
jgi:hypothetical protein